MLNTFAGKLRSDSRDLSPEKIEAVRSRRPSRKVAPLAGITTAIDSASIAPGPTTPQLTRGDPAFPQLTGHHNRPPRHSSGRPRHASASREDPGDSMKKSFLDHLPDASKAYKGATEGRVPSFAEKIIDGRRRRESGAYAATSGSETTSEESRKLTDRIASRRLSGASAAFSPPL